MRHLLNEPFLGGSRLWIGLVAICLMSGAQAATGHLSFADLQQCRVVLEELRWSHTDWPATNPTPKPPRSEQISDAEIGRKLDDSLRMEAALADLYRVQMDASALQTELNRIAVNTKAPERLREIYTALGNDPARIAECMVRPELAERRLREGYAHDARFHGALREKAESALEQGADAKALADSGGIEHTVTLVLREDEATSAFEGSSPDEIALDAEAFASEYARLLAVASKRETDPAPLSTTRLRETESAFIEEALLSATDQKLVVRSRSWQKLGFDA